MPSLANRADAPSRDIDSHEQLLIIGFLSAGSADPPAAVDHVVAKPWVSSRGTPHSLLFFDYTGDFRKR